MAELETTTTISNPYVGPRTFEEKDRAVFFGRERESRDLLSFVISEPLVLFYAQSGAGKSSLINARLAPGLREEGFSVLPIGRVGGALPEEVEDVNNVFVFNLLLSLDENRSRPHVLSDATIGAYLTAQKERGAAETNGDAIARVLIIDQFEEILTTHLDRWQERQAFFEQLGAAIANDPSLWVVLTIREDHIAALEPYASLLPGKLQARFYMQRMQAHAAQEAIEKPALQAGRPFAPGVAGSLVDNLRQIRVQEQRGTHLGEYVEPVQLQVVCYQLWENLKERPADEITAHDLAQLGDVDTALANFYENAIARAAAETAESEAKLRRWFERQLITEAGTRGIVYQGTETTAELDNRAVELLANQYLLRAERRAGGVWYELVHDRFIDPILKANQKWRVQQSLLYRAAEAWDKSGRQRDKLYQGEQLHDTLASVNRNNLDPLLDAFLTASEEAQNQRELAEMERQVEVKRRAVRRLRWLTTALVVVSFIALGAATVAFGQRNTLEQEVLARQTAEAAAQDSAQLAVANAAEAVAEQQTAVAGATEIAKAYEIVNASLATQAAYLEQQLAAAPSLTVETDTTEIPSTTTATSTPITPPTRDVDATSTAIALQAQLAQVRATQTAVLAVTPTPVVQTDPLFANFPEIIINVRRSPEQNDDNVIASIRGPERLRVRQAQGDWVQVTLPDGRLGWTSGHFLTYEGNRDLLPRGLKYRVTTGRDDLPFIKGKVISVGGASGDYLLRDPDDESSGVLWVTVGTEVTVLLKVNGSPSYGSGEWYLVDIVDSSGAGKLWTGYLPTEVVGRR